ncbi:MAG: hypothetical protein J7518_12475 [Nocardioidaceae bacterium]|nr:hypothetical protein [Nocardioidaceae bacterium]
MNLPTRTGERYMCFIVAREDRGYGGPYGQHHRPIVLVCEVCGHEVRGTWPWQLKQMADHHECGHAPCNRCGQMLLRRIDGTPRQHAHNRCPGKSPGDKIELEFVKNMSAREYA